jgi:riboflavin synthase
MFTGIIHHTARVLSAETTPNGMRLTVADPFPHADRPALGDSIATNGCCLTVAALGAGVLNFDVIPESLSKTNFGALRAGDVVHLERSLRFGDRIDGHLVQGHVDGTGELTRLVTEGEWRVTVRAPAGLAKYLIPKGSIAIDGVSLTLAAVTGPEFDVTLIPTTLDLTTLGRRTPGYRFNLEVDASAKAIVETVERLHFSQTSANLKADPSVT